MMAALLTLAPPLALVLALLLGGYPGERALERIARARHDGGAHRAPAPLRPVATRPGALPRGGRLIAAAMGLRGPPDRSVLESARRSRPALITLEPGVLT